MCQVITDYDWWPQNRKILMGGKYCVTALCNITYPWVGLLIWAHFSLVSSFNVLDWDWVWGCFWGLCCLLYYRSSGPAPGEVLQPRRSEQSAVLPLINGALHLWWGWMVKPSIDPALMKNCWINRIIWVLEEASPGGVWLRGGWGGAGRGLEPLFIEMPLF